MKTALPALRRCSREIDLPLSAAQQRLWFFTQLEPDSFLFNEPRAVSCLGSLDARSLQKALDAIIERHEVLRTTFSSTDGNPRQLIHTARKFALASIDLKEFTRGRQETELRRLLREFTTRPFDLEKDWPIRATLIELAEREHVLLLVVHHIASDGWSKNKLFRELWELYEAYSQGKPYPLQDLPIQYADYAIWQREWLQRGGCEAELAYWRSQLKGVSPIALPTDRPRPAVQGHAGRTVKFTIDRALTQGLNDLSRQHRVTLFMTLLAAFQTLLHRYSGQNDIVVGTPTAGRNRVEVEGLIGCFINMLVLRNDFSGNPTFKELLARVKTNAIDAYSHQDLPFEKLVEELQPERSLSSNPLFQVMFQLRNYPKQEFALGDLKIEEFGFEHEIAKIDLSLDLRDDTTGLSGSVEYRTELFDAVTVERMIGHFQVLLEGMVAEPNRYISDLPLLTETEKQLLTEWNQTKTDHPNDMLIHQLFEQQVESTPNKVAIIFADQQLSYRQLNAQANQLAHRLRKLGVGPDVPVAICLDRSVEMIVALLGTLKAGGSYLPLDPNYPKDRLALMLADAQPRMVLSQSGLIDKLPEHQAQVICMDRDWLEISQESIDNPAVESLTPQNLAYVIYTSGSTGLPKGVMIAHRSLVNFTATIAKHYGITSTDRVLQFAPMSFDASAEEIYPTLIRGAALLLRSDAMFESAETFWGACRDLELTVLNLPTAYWHQLAMELPRTKSVFPETLRLMIFGGEQAVAEAIKVWQENASSSVRLVNGYGPTEATVIGTLYKADENTIARNIPIGRPIDNVQIYILDKSGRPVPIGVSGELYIGGECLARGYLNRHELTAEKFIPNPFGKEAGARMYRTGDLARYLADGNIEFLGRIDNQVKIRGFRIELGEIETALAQHPSIREVVVIAREENAVDRRLVAYIVPIPGSSPSANQLRSYLQEKLPEYMVPSNFVLLDSLPSTANGKVNRKALPAPDTDRPELDEKFVAPQTLTEILLAHIWAEILQVDQVGIDDNFFDLGGHSLLATQAVSRIREAFHTEISLRHLFEHPTIAGVAKLIAETPEKKAIKEDLTNVLAEMESLSDEEAKRIVDAQQLKGIKG